jgi:hypothetical protein
MLDQRAALSIRPTTRTIIPFVEAPSLGQVLTTLILAVAVSAGAVFGIEVLGL